jgi:hypothetical protein
MLNKFVCISSAILSVVTTTLCAEKNAVEKFEEAWNNPQYTRFMAPAADINHIFCLQTDELLRQLNLTGTQLWEAEKKKAWDPKTYIPHVVSEGESFDKLDLGDEITFMRGSLQKSWLDPQVAVPVLEEVHVFERDRKVIFLGRTPNSATEQPLFHVEHSVGGTEENPTSLWRIIFLTSDKKYSEGLAEAFLSRPASFLPMFVQQYVRHDLGESK